MHPTVWGYSILAVSIISIAGLACVAVIPVMRRFYFDETLGFLVAMAVGTLTGDALLHLVPHVSRAVAVEVGPVGAVGAVGSVGG